MKNKKLLTMQDLSCVGQCSLTVALPILSANGIETCVLPTAILSNHTMFKSWSYLDLTDEIENIFSHWKNNDFKFDAFLLGYLGKPELIKIAEKCFKEFSADGAKVIIDEAGIEYNNRNYKAFPQESIYFYKYHRHYRTSVDVFSQSYEDMDITLRRLAQNFYVVRRSLVPGCIVARRIRRQVGVDEQTKQIADLYAMGLPLLDTKRIFSPPLWKLFNSYSRKELPQKEWENW